MYDFYKIFFLFSSKGICLKYLYPLSKNVILLKKNHSVKKFFCKTNAFCKR